jgi:hypothetical protein
MVRASGRVQPRTPKCLQMPGIVRAQLRVGTPLKLRPS